MIPHHVVTGDGPPLVLSNSLGTTLYLWDDQVPALAEHFTLIRYDTRGHGDSETPPGPYTLDDVGQDVIDLLDHLEIARAHVAGISLGGMTAMWLGIHAPERVEKLALLCTLPADGPAGDVGRPRRDWSASRAREAIVDTTLQRWLTDAYDDQHARSTGCGSPSSPSTTRATPTAATPSSTWTSCPTSTGSPPRRS